MFVRKNYARLGAASVAVSALALAALAPASATPAALNTTLNPGAAYTSTPLDTTMSGSGTIVFAGSDTIQYVVADLADKWNSTNASTAINGKNYNILTYNALANDGSAVPNLTGWNGVDGTTNANITTPNGSGGGLKLLGATDANGGSVISFARSSSAPSTGTGLTAGGTSDATGYPFALDTVVLAVSANNTAAPASLTDAQVLSIYNGSSNNWSQVGGANAPLHPLQPKSGSGTAKFFASQVANIAVANGGSASISDGNQVVGIPNTYNGGQNVPEHSGAPLAADADAVVPISLGRAILWNKTNPTQQIRVIGGFKEQRALWIFARNSSTTAAANGQTHVNPDVYAGGAVTSAVLGGAGFFCSAAAQDIVMADGFYPLANGYCGVSKTTNGDIVPAGGTNNQDHIAPAAMYIDNPLLTLPTTGGNTTTPPPPAVTKSVSVSSKIVKVKKGKAVVKVTVKGFRGVLSIKSGKKVIARVRVTKDGVVTIKIKAKKLKKGKKAYKVVLAGAPTKTIHIKK